MFNIFKKKPTIEIPDETIQRSVFVSMIDDLIGSQLVELGFEFVKSGKWILDTKQGIRKLVTISERKGGVYEIIWGYSFDSVPHFSNSWTKLNWHRTNKSATLDLYPIYFDFSKFTLDMFVSEEIHKQNIVELLPKLLSEIKLFKQSEICTEALVDICKKSEKFKGEVLDFWCHTQLPLSYAFLLNKSGKPNEAFKVIEKYFSGIEISSEIYDDLLSRLGIEAN